MIEAMLWMLKGLDDHCESRIAIAQSLFLALVTYGILWVCLVRRSLLAHVKPKADQRKANGQKAPSTPSWNHNEHKAPSSNKLRHGGSQVLSSLGVQLITFYKCLYSCMSALNWTLFFGSRTRLVQSAIQIPPNSLSAALKLRQGLCLGEVASLCRGTNGDDLWRLDTLDCAKMLRLSPWIPWIHHPNLSRYRQVYPVYNYKCLQHLAISTNFDRRVSHMTSSRIKLLGFDPRNSAPAGIDRSCWLQRWTAGSSAGRKRQLVNWVRCMSARCFAHGKGNPLPKWTVSSTHWDHFSGRLKTTTNQI
jgi:hypothetical protein